MTCNIIKVPQGHIALHHHNYVDSGFEILVTRCPDCSNFHVYMQSFEFCFNNAIDMIQEEGTFQDFLIRLFKETKEVVAEINLRSYDRFKSTYHVA